MSDYNREVFEDYLDYLQDLEENKEHFLGPHFCHDHGENTGGYALHLTEGCKRGHFLTYNGRCKMIGDEDHDDDADDLFDILRHASRDERFTVCLDPSAESNFGRYVGGVSATKAYKDANCVPFIVAANGYYHVLIVATKDCEPGEALQYYYSRRNKEEKSYEKIPQIPPPGSPPALK